MHVRKIKKSHKKLPAFRNKKFILLIKLLKLLIVSQIVIHNYLKICIFQNSAKSKVSARYY